LGLEEIVGLTRGIGAPVVQLSVSGSQISRWVKFVYGGKNVTSIETIEKFAGRLPEGDVEGHIRRSAHELTLAVEQCCGVEAAWERLMQAVLQLDAHNTTGRLRRDFENEAPSVTRLLEAIQEQLVPALKRAGYQV
jgi:hypothetical protein